MVYNISFGVLGDISCIGYYKDFYVLDILYKFFLKDDIVI